MTELNAEQADRRAPDPPAALKSAWALFLIAFALRAAYALAHYAAMGPEGLVTLDSAGFLGKAAMFAEAARTGALAGWDWLGPDPSLMPVYLWFLSAFPLIGFDGPLAPVLAQGALDAAGCVVIGRIGATVDPRLAAPAGWFAVLTPTLVVMSGLVLTDTIFLFTCVLMLWAALGWMRSPGWRAAILFGAALGLAAMTRVVIVPWALAAIAYMALAATWRGRLGLQQVAQLGAALAVALALFSPVLARNYLRYDAVALTSQSGSHLLNWVVPLTMEVEDGIPHEVGARAMADRFAKTVEAGAKANPFRESAARAALGWEVLGELGPAAVAKAWAIGGAINLFSPAVTMAPSAASLPRTGFYATAGDSKLEKIANFFLANDNALYAWLLGLGALGVVALRAVQLAGIFAGLFAAIRGDRDTALALLLLLAWVTFTLLVSGPVAAPKYRLPIEPAMAVFFALGFREISARWGRRRALSRTR